MHHNRYNLLKYGLEKKTNHIVGIDVVVNGIQCNCICPYCKQELVAKNSGEVREHHFAHYTKKNCPGARMTVLHQLAQQIIEKEKTVMLPDYQGKFYNKTATRITFDNVQTELTCGSLRPDCIGTIIGKENKEYRLWIEILVTHKVDEEKQKTIQLAGISCIEIDLSDLLDTDYSIESVSKRLTDEKNNRRWISCPEYEDIDNRKREEIETVNRWFECEDTKSAEYLIKKLKDTYYSVPNDSQEKNNDLSNNSYKAYHLFHLLVPNKDIISYINRAPKKDCGLELFYSLLHYYEDSITSLEIKRINNITENLNYYTNKYIPITSEEKITLEQYISLYIITKLKGEYNRDDFKRWDKEKLIESFLDNTRIRNEVLMIASVFFHHIVGSPAQSFGELSNEIIQEHPAIAELFLITMRNQKNTNKNHFSNNQTIIEELQGFVDRENIHTTGPVFDIISTCFDFKYKYKTEQHDYNESIIAKLTNKKIEYYNEKNISELNEMMRRLPNYRK